ncbi:hypothetical protein RLEG3_14460 [Rhizobium leguminosarum bv. trifolii WSM1689]|uniref:hypothetical protein n=1 Tax=Rhizobium leguminosarum TaxID=384 RepID=UPI0003E09868|nr:hypothetical protein [Rhizobium leguminosarum]AHF86674.1 hypothetical protein RLEG3_14460 [Rhizobium leguminosarum bv. trifolii WSM1689]MBY5738979.1 hypothetical protein [Rhizobium leguminosarum]
MSDDRYSAPPAKQAVLTPETNVLDRAAAATLVEDLRRDVEPPTEAHDTANQSGNALNWHVDAADVANAAFSTASLSLILWSQSLSIARMFWSLPMTMWQAGLATPSTDKNIG